MDNLFIIAFKSKAPWFKDPANPTMPDHAKHALECAQRFSGCNVVALTDMEEEGWTDITPYLGVVRDIEATLQQKYEDSGKKPEFEWDAVFRRPGAVFRWLVINEYLKKHKLVEPVFNVDWDVLILADLKEHFTKIGYQHSDYGVCYDNRGAIAISSAPYYVANLDCISIFSELVTLVARYGVPGIQHLTVGDMGLWRHLQSWGCFHVKDCGWETDGAVFDKSIALDLDIYLDDNGHNKKVVPVDGIPHFVRRSDGKLIRAVSLHCFCSWKTRTHLVMKALDSKSNDHDAISHS